MRRLVFAALAVLAAGGAFWLRERSSTSSFSPYSDAQLATLAAAYRAVIDAPPAPGATAAEQRERAIDAEVSLGQLSSERHRRLAVRGLVAVALLAVLGAALSRRRAPRGDRGEEARLRERVGDPALLLEGERQRAARLLGVTPDAPREVIDAVLAVRLAAHDPSRLEGIEPEVRRMVLEQRDALQRARDLLVGEPGRGPAGAAPQQ